MATFEYRSLDQKGKVRKGVLEADSARQVRQQLKEKGWVPLEISSGQASEKKPGLIDLLAARGRLRGGELALVTRQLATLIKGGLPVEQALSAIARQSANPRLERIILEVRAGILEGFGLAASLARFPGSFSEMYRATVAAGEKSGHLEQVLEQLSDYLETRDETGRSVSQAMVYPGFIMVFSLVVIVFLMNFVVPRMVEVFETQGQDLPMLTQVMMALSAFFQNWLWLMILLLVGAVAAFTRAMRESGFRMKVHQHLARMPLLGNLLLTADSTRLASTLAILGRSGVPLVEALDISAQVVTNLAVRESVQQATRKVREGRALSRSLDEGGWFAPMLIQMIASGEQSGELEPMLRRAADYQERDLSARVQAMVTLLGPLMLLTMAGFVMLVVLSVILPMMDINSMVG